MQKIEFILLILFVLLYMVNGQEPVTVARIKYDGGGDWYGNRTTFVNLFKYIRENTNVLINSVRPPSVKTSFMPILSQR